LLRVRDSKATVNLGFLLLSIWLVLTGLMPLLNINLPEMVVVMAVLGLVAGILILIGQ
jgi:prepilin-type N-terminal cleavage/methylation domain-containing protein